MADARQRPLIGEEAQLRERHPDGRGERLRIRQRGQPRRLRRPRFGPARKPARHAVAEIEHIDIAPFRPGQRPLMTLTRMAQLGFLAALHGGALALLVHLLQRARRIGPLRLLLVQLTEFAAEFAIAPDQILRGGRLA